MYYLGNFEQVKLDWIKEIADNKGYIYIFDLDSTPKRIKIGFTRKLSKRFINHQYLAKSYGGIEIDKLFFIGPIDKPKEIEDEIKKFAEQNLNRITDEWFFGDINIILKSPMITSLIAGNFSPPNKYIKNLSKSEFNRLYSQIWQMRYKNLSFQTICNKLDLTKNDFEFYLKECEIRSKKAQEYKIKREINLTPF